MLVSGTSRRPQRMPTGNPATDVAVMLLKVMSRKKRIKAVGHCQRLGGRRGRRDAAGCADLIVIAVDLDREINIGDANVDIMMSCTYPPRSLSDLMRMPFTAPFMVQLITVMFETPPLSVKLPMEMPWPVPYVLLVSNTPEQPPPTVKSSSPSLMSQFCTRIFVPETSHASVLGELAGARMITFWHRRIAGVAAADGDVKHRRIRQR